MRWLSMLGGAGLAAAALLAVIGGFPLDSSMPGHDLGIVMPTCGLTRGSTAIARGDLLLAWRYNPASLLVMGLGVVGVVRLLVGSLTSRWPNVSVRPTRTGWLAVVLLVVGLWIYQQSNADFIITSRL